MADRRRPTKQAMHSHPQPQPITVQHDDPGHPCACGSRIVSHNHNHSIRGRCNAKLAHPLATARDLQTLTTIEGPCNHYAPTESDTVLNVRLHAAWSVLRGTDRKASGGLRRRERMFPSSWSALLLLAIGRTLDGGTRTLFEDRERTRGA
jgi:hypothetical protein